MVSKKESYGTKNSLKYFIGYNDDDIIRPLLKVLKSILYKSIIPKFFWKSVNMK